MKAQSRRLHYVDALRGIAALMVVIQHGTEMAFAHAPPGTLRDVVKLLFLDDFNIGRAGVIAFFCISGFVIPFSFSGKRPLRGFIVARFFRLYPAYWVSIACAVAVSGWALGAMFSTSDIVANATMLQKLLHHPDIIGVYWTLFVELIFYALCFVLFAGGWLSSAMHLFTGFSVLLGMAVLASAGHAGGHALGGTGDIPFALATMVFGTLSRCQLLEGDGAARRYATAALMGLVVATPVVMYCGFKENSAGVGWVALTTGTCLGLLLFCTCVHKKAFTGRLTIFLGAISYALYLFHVPAAVFLDRVVGTVGWPLSATLFLPGMLVLSIVVATVVHWVIERPSIATGRMLK